MCYRKCVICLISFSAVFSNSFSFCSTNSFGEVNPGREKGQQLMDAGRVYFEDGTGSGYSGSDESFGY